MNAVIEYIIENWVEWFFAILLAFLGYGYRQFAIRLKIEQEKNEAIAMGVQSLLRESIVDNYNKYSYTVPSARSWAFRKSAACIPSCRTPEAP